MKRGNTPIDGKPLRKIWLRHVLAFSVGFGLAICNGPATAQSSEEQSVQNTVNQFFQALAERDRALLASITLPGSFNISTS